MSSDLLVWYVWMHVYPYMHAHTHTHIHTHTMKSVHTYTCKMHACMYARRMHGYNYGYMYTGMCNAVLDQVLLCSLLVYLT